MFVIKTTTLTVSFLNKDGLKSLEREGTNNMKCCFAFFDTGLSQWKKAWIAPVFKKGSRAEAANYRPVSLTPMACKTLEHIVCSHIRGHADTHNILGEEHYGFRKNHSTETQLILTTYDMLKQRDSGKQLDVIILDFSKAFDTVPHSRLLGKLHHYGIKGNLLRWIEELLVGRTQSVLVDGTKSPEEAVLSGVPQGTVLGPLMFLLYINDMPSQVQRDTRCRLLADDSLLYRVIDSTLDQVQLQQDLKNLEKWALDWGMVFNPSKCYVMHINGGRTHRPYLYELCGVLLKSVTQERYLGVILTQSLSWSNHISQVSVNANQKLGFIKRNLKGSPQELKRLAYITLVRSGMEYASPVWDPSTSKDQDALERESKREQPAGLIVPMIGQPVSPHYFDNSTWNHWTSAYVSTASPSCTMC